IESTPPLHPMRNFVSAGKPCSCFKKPDLNCRCQTSLNVGNVLRIVLALPLVAVHSKLLLTLLSSCSSHDPDLNERPHLHLPHILQCPFSAIFLQSAPRLHWPVRLFRQFSKESMHSLQVKSLNRYCETASPHGLPHQYPVRHLNRLHRVQLQSPVLSNWKAAPDWWQWLQPDHVLLHQLPDKHPWYQ